MSKKGWKLDKNFQYIKWKNLFKSFAVAIYPGRITIKPGSKKKLFIIIENMEQVAKQL